ncbi:hypothetical protein F8M41_012230 [Gigaspora margarita]|uniref:Uncharacterized protein n=1 Tax=Gigaspora margarita TaxID=4874 RepID=A0A8H3X052_GIGMA|nr:hypothetical protein F8M41_012230 [Gigaspora margarita]
MPNSGSVGCGLTNFVDLEFSSSVLGFDSASMLPGAISLWFKNVSPKLKMFLTNTVSTRFQDISPSASSSGYQDVSPGTISSGFQDVLPGAISSGLQDISPGTKSFGFKDVSLGTKSSGFKDISSNAISFGSQDVLFSAISFGSQNVSFGVVSSKFDITGIEKFSPTSANDDVLTELTLHVGNFFNDWNAVQCAVVFYSKFVCVQKCKNKVLYVLLYKQFLENVLFS